MSYGTEADVGRHCPFPRFVLAKGAGDFGIPADEEVIMPGASARRNFGAACADRVHTVYCPHKKLQAEVTASKWQMSDGQWTRWVIVDCPLLPAGLIDCDVGCMSQLQEILK